MQCSIAREYFRLLGSRFKVSICGVIAAIGHAGVYILVVYNHDYKKREAFINGPGVYSYSWWSD